MRFKQETEIINKLLLAAEFGIDLAEPGKEPFRSFGLGINSVVFRGFENFTLYQNQIESLFSSNNELNSSLTLKTFEKKVIELLRLLSAERRQATSNDVDNLLKELLSTEISNYEVFNELFGATMKSPKIHFGDFTIYNLKLSKAELFKKYPRLGAHEDLYFKYIKSNLLIGINIKAREQDKASEIADRYLRSFENIMSYAIADLSHNRTVGLFNFLGHRTRKALICNENTIGSHNDTLNMFIEFDLEDSYLKHFDNGNQVIWGLITKNDKTELEKRLLNSAEWIGKAIDEKDYPKSLFQFVIAIEGMLQFNEKSLITPSIVSQLSEWLAFIIEDELDKRKSIAKYFKDIYQKRSAIAHGGIKSIEKEDLDIALKISKLMVISFLTKEPFKSFKSLEQLNNHITELKFK
jgi:hypothetical protein